jgi:hypothetical protein
MTGIQPSREDRTGRAQPTEKESSLQTHFFDLTYLELTKKTKAVHPQSKLQKDNIIQLFPVPSHHVFFLFPVLFCLSFFPAPSFLFITQLLIPLALITF